MKVLLVEDNDLNGAALKGFLAQRDIDAEWAATGEAALIKIRVVHPDAIVMDYFLTDMDGGELLRQLRADGAASVPVVVMTAAAGSDFERVRAEAARHDAGVLRKDFEPEELVAILKELEGGSRGRAE